LEVKKGGDPAKDLSLRKAALTVAELCDKYLAEHVALRNKASTARDACRIVETRIRPALGGIKVADVKRADVIKWHNSMKAIPAEANRCLAYLSKMMTLASRDWNLRLDNPVSGVSRYPEVRRARFLSDEEFNRLGATLDQAEKYGAESLAVVAAIRLLALTGCRHAEIKTLKWEHVDFAKSCLRLPDSKTGAKVVHLADAAIDVLKKIPRVDGNPHVIPGAAPGAHFVNLQKAWVRFKNAAGLPDVRLHDLRHSFASVAVAEGMGLPVIGKILGHAQQTTTQNYAHLAADPVRLATEAIAVKISAAMSKS
jgi:integrase